MKYKHALLFAVVLVLMSARAYAATSQFQNSTKQALTIDRVVLLTGAFPDDVDNVQAAVDRGGTVLLKATDVAGNPRAFNFGPPVNEDTKSVPLKDAKPSIATYGRGVWEISL